MTRHHSCRTIILNRWSRYLALAVFAWPFVEFNFRSATCKAAESPTIAELRHAHSQLRAASRRVQGEFRVFRSETVEPAALEELPSVLGLPLVQKGYLWRSGQSFRVDYESYGAGTEVMEASLAIDEDNVYQFSVGNDELGMLQVCEIDTQQGSNLINSIEGRFYRPLDILWRSGPDTTYVDYLQRPDTEIVPNRTLSEGYSLLISQDGGSKARFELEPASNHAFAYADVSEEEVELKMRAFSISEEGAIFPARYVELSSFGENSGYTKVVAFDLEPLEPESPISHKITAASFRNLGVEYQVYYFRGSGEELGERYERAGILSSDHEEDEFDFLAWFLWASGAIFATALGYIMYRYFRTKKI